MDDVTFFFGGWEPVARVLVVGMLMYAALVLLLRVSGKRTLARMNAFDFLVTVALGASFGRALTARSVALVEALAAFLLLVLLQFAMAWLQARSLRFARAVTSPPSLLYFRGRFLRAEMRRQRVAESELLATVREHGAGSLHEVEAIVLESDGRFAVVTKERAGDGSAIPRPSDDG